MLNGAAGGRVCVLVLGMHRSGTSALARTLNLLGCDLPKTLVPEAPGNEAGHWESAPVCKLNDALLDSAGTNWRDFEAVNPDWFRSPKAAEFRARAIATLRDEFGESFLFVLKDPRISRIAGWWAETIEATGASPAIICIVRHPHEVAESLKKRDNFDIALGVLLWLRNTLDAEVQTRGRARAFVSYDGLLSDWTRSMTRAQAALSLAFPKRQSFVTPAIDQFLSDKHRHHRRAQTIGGEGVNAWASEAFAILDRWATEGERAADYAALDAIRVRLNDAGHAFARLVALQWYHQGQTVKLEKGLAEAEKRAAETDGKLAEAQKRLQMSAAEIGDVKSRLSQTESALRQRSLEAEESARHVSSLKSSLAKALERVAAEEAALKQRLAEVEAARRQETQAARAEIERLTASLTESNAVIAARFDEIAALSRLLKGKDEESDGLRQSLAETRSAEIARTEETLKAFASAPLFPAMRGRQLRRRAALLKATGLFDADWYSARYADIAATGIDPAVHFLTFGVREGRHPNADVARARGER